MSIEARQVTGQTPVQQHIESMVTNGLGYRSSSFRVTVETVKVLVMKNTPIGLQSHLGELEMQGCQVDAETERAVNIMTNLCLKNSGSVLGIEDLGSLVRMVDSIAVLEQVARQLFTSGASSIPVYPGSETLDIGGQRWKRSRIERPPTS